MHSCSNIIVVNLGTSAVITKTRISSQDQNRESGQEPRAQAMSSTIIRERGIKENEMRMG